MFFYILILATVIVFIPSEVIDLFNSQYLTSRQLLII